MIAISIAITTSALFISIAAIYAVYTWAEVQKREGELKLKRESAIWEAMHRDNN